MNTGLMVVVILILIGLIGKASVKIARAVGVDTSEFECEPFHIPIVIDDED